MTSRLECVRRHFGHEERPKNKKKSQYPDWILKQRKKNLQSYLLSSLSHQRNYRIYRYSNTIIRLQEKTVHSKDWPANVSQKTRGLQGEFVAFPDSVKSFVESSDLPKNTLDRLKTVLQQVEEYLKSQNYKFSITSELFVDPEEYDSKEIKISIEINKDLRYINDNLKSPIYDIIFNNIPLKILEKILIKLEPF